MSHFCHAWKCTKTVPPRMLMCLRHWKMVPKALQLRVWKYYRPGQEIDKRPSPEYLFVVREAITAVRKHETSD